MRELSWTVACGVAVSLLAARAMADDLPQGSAPVAPASNGNTEITAQKFEAAGKPQSAKDATELSVGAGGLASSGNARLLALTGSAQFRLRRSDDQLTLALAGNYSRTATPHNPLVTTVENVQSKLRYDRFFLSDWTAFLGAQARNDRFQGLDLRLQLDPGIGYYLVNEPKQLLWFEIGYDVLHDIRRDEDRLVLDSAGQPTGVILDKTSTVSSGRAFAGYGNQLSDAVSVTLGLEYLQGLSNDVQRFYADAKVTSKLIGGLSLATSISIRYDSRPLPGKENVDSVTAINLVYQIW